MKFKIVLTKEVIYEAQDEDDAYEQFVMDVTENEGDLCPVIFEEVTR